jgi:hypothetical protein
MNALYVAMLVGLTASAACSKPKEEPATDSHRRMAMDSGHMRGMAGMESAGMMPMMQAHMDSMMRMTPEQMSQMMNRHDRMMSQMMDQMGSEMRQMKMSETQEWSALTDSVKRDLAELPSLKDQALSAGMRAHADRVRRLMAAHDQMLKAMR